MSLFTVATTDSSFATTPKKRQTRSPSLQKASCKLKTQTMRRINQAVNNFVSARRIFRAGKKEKSFRGTQLKNRLGQVSRSKGTKGANTIFILRMKRLWSNNFQTDLSNSFCGTVYKKCCQDTPKKQIICSINRNVMSYLVSSLFLKTILKLSEAK